ISSPVAARSWVLGTSSGINDCHPGSCTAAPAPSANVKPRSRTGGMCPAAVSAASRTVYLVFRRQARASMKRVLSARTVALYEQATQVPGVPVCGVRARQEHGRGPPRRPSWTWARAHWTRRHQMARHLQLRRVYDDASPDDGIRVLVDRVWPRGLTKDAA